MHNFDVQGKTALINQRVAAYSELLLDIATFDSDLANIYGYSFTFQFACFNACCRWQSNSRGQITALDYESKFYDYRDHDFGVLIHESKSAMEAEIRAEKAKAKHWWQFWR